jgi:hypothetical protein
MLLAIIIPLFMILFRPFNFTYAEHRFSFPVIAIIFGLVDSTVFFISAVILQKLFPRLTEEKRWTLIRELGFWAILLFCIGVTNFLLREIIYINPNNLSVAYLLEEITHSYLFGLLIATLLTLINFAYLIISTTQKASNLNQVIQKLQESREESKPEIVTIQAESEQDTISFNPSDLIYVKVDGNYVEIYLRDEEGKVQRYIKRNTLKNVEEQLMFFPRALRIHRSYLVNLDQVTSVEGNAQGYQLGLEDIEQTIPVSRSYISDFDAVMNN